MLARRRRSASNTVDYDVLDPRQMLASVSFDLGVLTISGTIGDDELSLFANSVDEPVQLLESETVIGSYDPANIQQVIFIGGEGNDSFQIHGNAHDAEGGFETNNLFADLNAVRFYGGGGNDELTIRFGDFSGLTLVGVGGSGDDSFLALSTSQTGDDGLGNSETRLFFYGNEGDDDLRTKGLTEGLVRLFGNDGNDLLVTGDSDDLVFGGNGRDRILAGKGDDTLVGGSDHDQLDGQEGNDDLIDHDGDDHLVGGSGDDWVFGGDGNDVIIGGNGDDQLLGGNGDDYLAGFNGADRILGGLGNDHLHGGEDDDLIFGSHGNDSLIGHGGNDRLFGELGDDSLIGGTGNDELLGGIGNDLLAGQDGDDILFGNEGIDTLLAHAGADFLDGGQGNDYINTGIDLDIDRSKGGLGSDSFDQFVAADILLDFQDGIDVGFPRAELTDGVRMLTSREVYDLLARRENFPGAIDAQEVKFIIMGVDTDSPELHFMNTNTRDVHYEFARDVLGVNKSINAFNSETYFTNANRKNLAGSLVSHDSYTDSTGTEGLFTLEVWPTDPMAFRFVDLAFNMISDSAPWLRDILAVHQASETFKEAVAAEQASYDASNIRLIDTDDLFGNLEYQPMNQAETFGRLILADGSTTVTARDIPIFKTLPNDLSTVSGIITTVPQTPLSHVNLKAKQNNTPNAFVKDATTDPDLTPFLDKLVFFKVGPNGFEIRVATQEEVDLHFESVRPSETQIPERDLSVVDIKPLSEIGFADTNAYGAKASNVAELQNIMPDVAPDGFAIPYSFYDSYMAENGFYDEAQAMMDNPEFQSDPEVREDMLKAFRKRIKNDGTIPDWINDQLTALQASFAEGITPRLRSSANAEDLVGFSGAGLYDSFTHKEDEGHISKSVKQVWASLWNYRAFEERDFFRVDHLESAMGILVHPNFKDELANGVGVTKNIFDPYLNGNYFNVQIGEDLVTNPDAESIPEEFLVAKLFGFNEYETQYIRSTNQLPTGERILSLVQITDLVERMDAIDAHFAPLYGRSVDDINFSMEIEFKITVDGDLAIKQARPFVG